MITSTAVTEAPKRHTPGPWTAVKSFNGFRVVRTWSSGFYQVMRAGHLRTYAEAVAAIDAATGSAS